MTKHTWQVWTETNGEPDKVLCEGSHTKCLTYYKRNGKARAGLHLGYDITPPEPCKHPPSRVYSWQAYDGTMCVACCDCGKVLSGGASLPSEEVIK